MFGRDNEFTDIERDIHSGFWPVLLGPKRVGKTSIMKVIVKENAGIYVDASTSVTAANLGTRLIDEVESGRVKVSVNLDFGVLKTELSKQPIRTLERFLKKIGEKIIAIDEAQNLNDPMLPGLLSVVYNETKVRMMFSGSQKGLLKRFSGGQMLGRPVQNEEVRPFDLDTARAFLQAGFDSCRVSYEEREIEESVKTFGGIAGWLSYYDTYLKWGQPGERYDLSFEELASGRYIVGDPAACIEELSAYMNELAPDHISFRMTWPGMKHADVLNSIRLFGEKIIPYFKEKS